jgi:hypothetical protein
MAILLLQEMLQAIHSVTNGTSLGGNLSVQVMLLRLHQFA